LRWLLLLEEYRVTIEYLSVKKNVTAVAGALFCLESDSLKIQEETQESLILLSGSENSTTSKIKYTIPMNTALIFREQEKIKGTGLREKALS
jgi:hypothetical protein